MKKLNRKLEEAYRAFRNVNQTFRTLITSNAQLISIHTFEDDNSKSI